MDILEQPWWTYVTVSVGFFLVCLALNYAVKKLNEARMGERLVRVLEKSSLPQCTHVNGPLITVPSEGEPRTISVKAPQPYSPPAISLVFDKEENKRIGDVYNMVKPITDWKYSDPSLNDNKSEETINVMPISSDHNVSESSPIQKIECELVTAKGTSSHNFSEKILIKEKIDSYDLITPKDCSYSEIPGLAGCKTNSVSAKEPGRKITGGTFPNEPKNTVAESKSFSNIFAGRMVHTNNFIVENTVKNTKVIKDKKSREKIDTGCLDSIMSKIADLKNMDDNPRIEKSATNTIIAKSSSSHSGSVRNEIKITSNEKKESSCIAAKESTHTHYNRVGKNIPVNTSKSEQILPKETSFDAQNESLVREYVSITNNDSMNSSSNERSYVSESVPFKNTEYGPILAKASYMDKIDSSDLPDLVTIKNYRFEQIPGGLPFTGKDLYTNKLISESESTFSNTDILATEERVARKGSARTLVEGTTSNDPTNSVDKDIPFKNIGSGRIFPTNICIKEIAVKDPKVIRDKKYEEIDTGCLSITEIAVINPKVIKEKKSNEEIDTSCLSITEIAVKDPKVIRDKKYEEIDTSCLSIKEIAVKNPKALRDKNSNEELDTSCLSITKTAVKDPKVIRDKQSNEEIDTSGLASLKSKISNFKNMNDDTRTEKSSFLSNRNVTKISSVEKTESKRILPDTQFKRNLRDYASIRNSVRLIELKKTSSNERSSSNVTEYFPVITSEPGRIVARQTALPTRSDTNVTIVGHALDNAAGRIVAETTPSHTQSPIRKSEFGFLAAQEISNRQSDDNVPGTNIATPPNTQSKITISKDSSIKKTASASSTVKETSNRQTEINVSDTDIVQIDGLKRAAIEEKSLRKLVLSNYATEYVTIKTSGSGSIVARETASRTLSGSDVLNPIEMSESGSIVAKIYDKQSEAFAVKEERLRDIITENNATEYVIFNTSGSGSIVARETASPTLSGPAVLNPIKMSESGSIIVNEMSLSKRQSEDSVPDKN